MAKLSKDEKVKVSNVIAVNDDGIIELSIHGPQNRHSMQDVHEELRKMINVRIAQGQKVNVLTDISAMNGVKNDAGARQEIRAMLADLSIDKSAIYGSGIGVRTAMFLAKIIGLGGHVKLFGNRTKAERWLKGDDGVVEKQPPIGLVGGLVVAIVGLIALIGWQIGNNNMMAWSNVLRPINPMSAVALIVMGFGLISYWAKRMIGLRVAGVYFVIFGVLTLTPLNAYISTLLFESSVLERGTLSEVSYAAAICFIILGLVALTTQRPTLKSKWFWRIEVVAIAVVIVSLLVNVFAHLYARGWLYENHPHYLMGINLSFGLGAIAIGMLLISIYQRRKINVIAYISRVGWLIFIVLMFAQSATYIAWSQANLSNKAESTSIFEKSSLEVENTLKDRINSYASALYGFQGLFRASESISQAEFEAYYNTTNTAQQYPGLRALSFISKVNESELPVFIKNRREDKSLYPEGNPSFAIRQKSSSNEHYILTYIVNSNSIPGADLGGDPERVAAFEEAAATRNLVVTGKIKFAATATQPAQEGFFITVPVSYAENSEKIIGYVNAVFNYDEFFADTFNKDMLNQGLNITLTDTRDNTIVFDSNSAISKDVAHSANTSIAVANRSWNLHVTAPRNFGNTEDSLPLAILVGGQAFSILLLVIFLNQARSRQRALNLADSITKDLQLERNLAVSNDFKTKAILSSIGDGVFAVDVKKRITVLNPAAQHISGVAAADAIGRPYDEILHFVSEKTGKVNDSFIRKALGGHLATMANHTMIIRPDGSSVPVADSAAPIRDVTGTIIGAIVVFRDVTTEQQLDKAKTEFVSLASHQLRTPLSAINWYGEMLLNGDAGKLTKDQYTYIKEIFEGSQRMVELVNSLLDVSRLEVGKLINRPEETSLTDIVSSIRKELEVSIKSKNLIVHETIQSIPSVMADPKQLRMIVQNLMSNAVKYTTEKNTIHVTLRTTTPRDMQQAGLKSTEAHWYFSVQDTGFGIPNDQKSKIFTKLFRADNVRKLDVEGTGLGLYIVKEVVEKMGGKVWFESTEGKGSTFYVIAPVNVKYRKNDV